MADVENVHFGDEMLELVRTLLRPVDFVLTVPLLSLSASAFYENSSKIWSQSPSQYGDIYIEIERGRETERET